MRISVRISSGRRAVLNGPWKKSPPAIVRSRKGSGHELGVESQHHRPPVTGWVGVAERAADGPEVADQGVGDLARSLAQDRADAVEARVTLQIDVPRARPDPERRVVGLDA